ncbi:MAG: hypothetical protein F6K44_30330 [Moorea sp. SIO3E2]|nr:hypothetical protein [Moorena sp. SIO3E2]
MANLITGQAHRGSDVVPRAAQIPQGSYSQERYQSTVSTQRYRLWH